MRDDRELDLLLVGATGFVGRLTAAYLAAHAPEDLRVGLAGRDERRLKDVRDGLGDPARTWPVLVADTTTPGGAAMAARAARVVVTTVGPYRRLGLELARACAGAGTDYADLTGEILFVRDTIGQCHDAAVASGARIVHSCGFDSIPSDLGVLLAHQAAAADGAGPLTDTTLVVTALRGGMSGGTLASGMGQFEEARTNPEAARTVADPYAFSPDRKAEPSLGDESDLAVPRHDDGVGQWTGPFLMAYYNTRIVRRSNALQEWAYGREFRYREVMGFGTGAAGAAKAAAVACGSAVAQAALTQPAARALVSPLLPKPGTGPGEKARASGFFRIEVHARTSSGARYVTDVRAPGDPGYAGTAVMLGESGLCLALDQLPARGGVLTPATAMGPALADRLRAAGHTYNARRVS